jgi:hypothetical protein
MASTMEGRLTGGLVVSGQKFVRQISSPGKQICASDFVTGKAKPQACDSTVFKLVPRTERKNQ